MLSPGSGVSQRRRFINGVHVLLKRQDSSMRRDQPSYFLMSYNLLGIKTLIVLVKLHPPVYSRVEVRQSAEVQCVVPCNFSGRLAKSKP
jgi:hypothetical protein